MNCIYDLKSYTSTTKYAFLLYFFSNIACAFYFIFDGYIGGDFSGYDIPVNYEWMALAFLITTLTFFFYLFLMHAFFKRIKIKKIPSYDGAMLDVLSTLIISFGLYSVIVHGVGRIGVEEDYSNVTAIYRRFTSILQPSLFGLIYFFYRSDFKRFLVVFNLLLYLVLIISSGQTGQLLLLFFLCIYIDKKSPKYGGLRAFIPFLIFCFGLLFYPFIRLLKEAVIQSVLLQVDTFDLYESYIISDDFADIYIKYFFITLERFQIVANIQYLLENRDDIYNHYNVTNSGIHSFFLGHWLTVFFAKSLGIVFSSDMVSPQNFLALQINGSDSWASHIGVFGFFVFYGFNGFIIIIFSVLCVLLSSFLSNSISSDKRISLLTFLMILQLLCHGWVLPFFNYLQSLFVFAFILIFLDMFKYIKREFL
ncbi:oligosaccharide repeat unit polymerase [Aeromonas caviae]